MAVNLVHERVTHVHHWTDSLFTIRTTRDPGFRFRSGEFTMIGIDVDGRPLTRAYSIASSPHVGYLEWFSIKVQNGPLTSRLQHIKVGDTLLVAHKPTGTLLLDNLRPGKTLWLISTGTGLAPFLSLIQDPETYERFERVVVTHTCRTVEELAYADFITKELPQDEFLGEMVTNQLVYYPTVTREPFKKQGRITDLIQSGELFADLGRPGHGFSKSEDRVMFCGSPELMLQGREMMKGMGFTEGNSGEEGDFVIEKAYVDK